MGLRKRFDAKNIFIFSYFFSLVIYFAIGLYPVDALNYKIDTTLMIPRLNLEVDVAKLSLSDGKLITPDNIVGSYSRFSNKTLLIGHSATVFEDLYRLNLSDIFIYNNKAYRIVKIDKTSKNNISMSELLSSSNKNTVVIMTCAGSDLGAGDSTHRFILTGVGE